MAGYAKFMRGSSKLSILLFLMLAGALTISALIDQLFDLGWGYRWIDFWAGLAMCMFALVIHVASMAWFSFIWGETGSRPDRARNVR